MDIYLTIEEKYLKAVDHLNYGKITKALKLLNAIIADEPFYARAHYQLGKLYYFEINDYQAAGYHFKTCVELEPRIDKVENPSSAPSLRTCTPGSGSTRLAALVISRSLSSSFALDEKPAA